MSDYELQDLFKEASLPLPGYKVREIVEKILVVADNNKDGKISFEEFVSVSNQSNTFLVINRFVASRISVMPSLGLIWPGCRGQTKTPLSK